MTMQPTTSQPIHELARRTQGGLDVTLLWNEVSNRAWVTVADEHTGDFFELGLTEADNALDVYNHPYAYAAALGAEHGRSVPEDEWHTRDLVVSPSGAGRDELPLLMREYGIAMAVEGNLIACVLAARWVRWWL